MQNVHFALMVQYVCLSLNFFTFWDVKVQVKEEDEEKEITVKFVDIKSYKDWENANNKVHCYKCVIRHYLD